MTFNEWIDARGVEEVARLLDVSVSTVRHWRVGHVFPQVAQMIQIKKLSRGVIGYDAIIDNPTPGGWGKSSPKNKPKNAKQSSAGAR